MKEFVISLGKNPAGHKQFEGDGKTPEGIYFITTKSAKSGFHKNLGISYPNRIDQANAKKKNMSPGGDVKIHGLKNGLGFIGKFQRLKDWTNGCIALTNAEVDDLYNHIELGCTITIIP